MQIKERIKKLKNNKKKSFIFPSQNISLSGSELYNHIKNISYDLKTLRKLNANDKVAILYNNSVEYLILCFYLILRGLVIVPINPLLSSIEIKKMFLQSQSRLIITGRENSRKIKNIKSKIIFNYKTISKKNYDFKLNSKSKNKKNKPILLLYTSGSTGVPKGSLLSETNIASNTKIISKHHKLNSKTKTLVLMPMFHNSGFVISFLSTFFAGGSAVIAPANFVIYNFWKLVNKYKITYTSVMPSVLSMIIKHAKYHKNKSLKIMACGGQKLSSNLIRRFEKKYKLKIIEHYGLTETTSISTLQPFNNRKLSAVGKTIKGTKIKLLNEKNVFTSNGPGEICIQGGNVISGYFNNKSLNKEKFFKNYLRTGDYGYFDKNKNLNFSSRKDYLIIKGGENIYPAEVENVLYELTQINECAVVGCEDKIYGQEVYAFLKVKKFNKNLEQYIFKHLGKSLAKFKIPKKIFFLGVNTKINEFPKTVTKKIIYSRLQDILRNEIKKK